MAEFCSGCTGGQTPEKQPSPSIPGFHEDTTDASQAPGPWWHRGKYVTAQALPPNPPVSGPSSQRWVKPPAPPVLALPCSFSPLRTALPSGQGRATLWLPCCHHATLPQQD